MKLSIAKLLFLTLISPLCTAGQTSASPRDSVKVGLVMSGGGAKGLFHLGVLKALEENDIPVDYVAGTSMGAIVAGLYSMGYNVDEMIAYFSSQKFDDLLNGEIPAKYRFFSQEMDESPKIFHLSFDFKGGAFKPLLPTNLIPPYRMDLEFVKLTSSATAACRNNFDSLMIPFRCVASDINAHKPFVMKTGNLGTAIRASMSYPFVFKPVLLDSTLLFDGGFYNNFPWDVMISEFNPDFVIGSQCSTNPDRPDESDIVSQVASMLMYDTNYEIPDSIGILIDQRFQDVGILDFGKIGKLVETGYVRTMLKMDDIKRRIPVRRSREELATKRRDFKSRCVPLIYDGAKVTGGSIHQNTTIERILTKNAKTRYDHNQLEAKFFSVISMNLVQSFYPGAEYDFDKRAYVPVFRINPSPRFKILLGGNASTSAGNMIYAGIEALNWNRYLTRLRTDLTFGKLYSSAQIGIRQDYPLSYPLFTEICLNVSVHDFYKGSQSIFQDAIRPPFLKEFYEFFSANVGRGITKNSRARAGFTVGFQNANYYETTDFKSTDTLSKSSFPFFSPHLIIDKNTYNFKQYPTEGHYMKITFGAIFGTENYRRAATPVLMKQSNRWLSARLISDYILSINKYVSLGFYTEICLSSKFRFFDYYPTLNLLPVFQPTPHSRTFMLENYRANTYVALGIKPIVKIGKNLSFQADTYVFQPYETLQPDMSYVKKPKYLLTGSTSAVWHSPIGPLSVSVNYYEKNYSKLYFFVNFGYLIFNRKAIIN